MEKILAKEHYRKPFFLTVGLLIILGLVVRYFVLPDFDPNLSLTFAEFIGMLLDGFIISLIITVALGTFLFWLTPKIMKKSVMDVIEPKEIGPLLKKAAIESRSWIFKGVSGRYSRSVTLPEMAREARLQSLGRDVSLYLLNPAIDSLCEEYSVYRNSLKSSNGKDWSQAKVRNEVIATVISAIVLNREQPLLGVKLFFVNHFSAFRLDISDQYVIVTKEDKEAAGLKADKESYFYASYKDDIRLLERQSVKVDVKSSPPSMRDINSSDIKTILCEMEVFSTEQIHALDYNKILELIQNPKNPYSSK